MPVAPDLQALLDAIEASDAPAMHEGTPDQARASLRALMVDARDPGSVVTGVEVRDDEVAGRPARVYRPEDAEAAMPTLLFLHGGGFVIGDLDTHDALCRLLARECWLTVVSLDYPLAPEHPFPAAADLVVRAMREVHERRHELGGDERLAVGGDSAGGNLAAVVAQQCRDLDLVAQLLLYPAVDPLGEFPSREENGEGFFLDLPTMIWFQTHYSGVDLDPEAAADPRLAPLRGQLADVAPAYVATAEMDPLRDEGEAYADALAAAGVRVERQRYAGQIHGFAQMDHLAPSSREALTDVLTRFRVLLHG